MDVSRVSLDRYVHRELRRSVVLDVTPIIPATACHQRNDVEAYSRYKTGQIIDFLLTEQRDEQAALRFLKQAIRRHGVPEKITIDGSAANEAAITS
jgi:hypothetical protein